VYRLVLSGFILLMSFESAFANPNPIEDPRCGAMGWSFGMGPIPIAYPRVVDLSPGGDLAYISSRLAGAMASEAELSGVFLVRPESLIPQGPVVTWFSEAAFDYEGWRRTGAWLVIVGEMSAKPQGIHLVLSAYLTEEGQILRVKSSECVVPVNQVETFGRNYVKSLLLCVTGLHDSEHTRIAFARRAAPGKPKKIYVVEIGKEEVVQVSPGETLAILPSWAPGGKVAWTDYRSGNPDLWIDGELFSNFQGQNSGAAFSPDGKTVALTVAPEGNPNIWLLDAKTSKEVARLTDTERTVDTNPTWSPDGKQIAFVSDRSGKPQIYVMNSDGSNQRLLPLPGTYNTSPDWSPDGGKIAYQSRGDKAYFSVWVYDVATGEASPITKGPWNDESPSWSPDGRKLVFTSTRDKKQRLYLMNRDGSGVRPLFKGKSSDKSEDFTPAWERFW